MGTVVLEDRHLDSLCRSAQRGRTDCCRSEPETCLHWYFANEPMDRLNKGLFTFAAYNAGPGRIRQLRQEAGKQGLDPNVWFGNVEQVASERIGRETVTYVSNIYKYYVAYRLVLEERERRAAAAAALVKDVK